ncbi:hypothetical protein D9M70_581520 [compost metagenome]
MNLCLEPGMDLGDILRLHPRRDDQCAGVRHEVGQRLSGADDAACRMNTQIHDHSVVGRPDLGSRQLIIDGVQTLTQLRQLVFRIAQRERDFIQPVAAQLDDIGL